MKAQKIILSSSLILSLVVFNFPLMTVAQEVGGEAPSSESADTVIDTGDANTGLNIDNTVNTSDTSLGNSEPSPTPSETPSAQTPPAETPPAQTGENQTVGDGSSETTTQTEEPLPSETPSSSPEPTITPEQQAQVDEAVNEANNASNGQGDDLTVVNDNNAEVGNNAELESATGQNEAQNNEGDVLIDTGDANVAANVSNVVNTNLFGSAFYQLLLSIFKSFLGDIDLSAQINANYQNTCPIDECSFNLNIINQNLGLITNNLLLNALTGGNLAASTDGSATINTGDANVAANALNILNSNIIGSNWTNFMINIFDDWEGDLVLPGRDEMLEMWASSGPAECLGGVCPELNISNTDEADVANGIIVNADTGSNEASGGQGAEIETGSANIKTKIFNLINTSITGGKWFLMIVNNFGSWQGNIFSLPSGFAVGRDEQGGYEIYNSNLNGAGASSDGSNSGSPFNSVNVINSNFGKIINSFIINALTGGNTAQSTNATANITTGNANVLANLINILNTNIFGGNFLLGIVNIFGTWHGDLAFGRPDNWIAASANTNPAPAVRGGQITYTLTFANKGNADATGVVVVADFDESALSVANPGGGEVLGGGRIRWQLGGLAIGDTGTVAFTANINPGLPESKSALVTQSSIDSFEDDQNDQDNSDTILVNVFNPLAQINRQAIGTLFPWPNLQLSQQKDVAKVYPGDKINFTIKLYNKGPGTSFNSTVHCRLQTLDDKTVLGTQSWNVGELLSREEARIKYTLEISPLAGPGQYINSCEALGFDRRGDLFYSNESRSLLEILAVPEEESGQEAPEEPLVSPIAEISLAQSLAEKSVLASAVATRAPKLATAASKISDASGNLPEVLAVQMPAEPESEMLEEVQEEIPPLPSAKKSLLNLYAAISSSISLHNLLLLFIITLAAGLLLFILRKRYEKDSSTSSQK